MFSLVIVIVSIALVAALALATLYYGGSSLNKGSGTADAAQLINTGQQISSALLLRDTDVVAGALPSGTVTLASLEAGGYLRQPPQGWSVGCSGGLCQVQKPLGPDAEEACRSVNAKSGLGETLDVTVFALATSLFHCQAVEDGNGQPSNYVFNYLYKRGA